MNDTNANNQILVCQLGSSCGTLADIELDAVNQLNHTALGTEEKLLVLQVRNGLD